jgi:hypothetical protein
MKPQKGPHNTHNNQEETAATIRRLPNKGWSQEDISLTLSLPFLFSPAIKSH